MQNLIKKYLLLSLILPTLATAHGPSRVLILEEIEINASASEVWTLINNFCSIKEWHPNVKNCTNDKGNEPNSLRTITLDNDEKIKEILAKHQPEKFMIQHYMQNNQKLETYPISTHSLKITITDNGKGGSIMKWKGAFYRSFQGPTPPHELSDETATKKLTFFYRAGLENIKQLSESQ